MNEKIKLDCVVLCEGKYDKIKLSSFIDAVMITTDGFGIFNNQEKKALLRKICKTKKLVILTDSDSAGFLIRNKLSGFLGKENIINLYIPQIKGKEKRKLEKSKEGFLGVEGIVTKSLYKIFEKASLLANPDAKSPETRKITKTDFYNLGLSGKPDSSEKRKALCRKFDLPESLSANALIEAVNLLSLDIYS